MGRKERKYMSLEAAIEEQKDQFPIEYCYNCGEKTSEIQEEPYSMSGITVWDYPKYICKKCGCKDTRLSITIAIENLKSKHHLHGGYTIKDLLEIEKDQCRK